MFGFPVPVKLPRTIILFHNPHQSQTNINYFNKSKSPTRNFVCLQNNAAGKVQKNWGRLQPRLKALIGLEFNWHLPPLWSICTVGYCTLLTFNCFCPVGPTNNSHAYVRTLLSLQQTAARFCQHCLSTRLGWSFFWESSYSKFIYQLSLGLLWPYNGKALL